MNKKNCTTNPRRSCHLMDRPNNMKCAAARQNIVRQLEALPWTGNKELTVWQLARSDALRQIELHSNAHWIAQKQKNSLKDCQSRTPLPHRTDIVEDFQFKTAAAEQKNIKLWHCHKQNVQQHKCRQSVPAVLKSRAHSLERNCNSEADSSTQSSKRFPSLRYRKYVH